MARADRLRARRPTGSTSTSATSRPRSARTTSCGSRSSGTRATTSSTSPRELDDLAERANEDPEAYSWSYSREFTDARLVVVDSRAARVLEPDRRDLLDDRRERRGSTSRCAAT